jgi:hypothetical protein
MDQVGYGEKCVIRNFVISRPTLVLLLVSMVRWTVYDELVMQLTWENQNRIKRATLLRMQVERTKYPRYNAPPYAAVSDIRRVWWVAESMMLTVRVKYEDVSTSFRTGHLERELQMVQHSAARCSCITILWVSLVSFAAITLYVASQRVIPKVRVYFVIDLVQKLLDTPLYLLT